MSESVWVTGASGFIGQHLVRELKHRENYTIVALTRQTTFVDGADHTYQIDITDPDAIKDLVDLHRPIGVYHLAGLLPPSEEQDLFKVNVQGTYSLLNALYSKGIKELRVLISGSAAEYVPKDDGYYSESDEIGGATPYGRSKSAQTMLALSASRSFGIDVRIARTFNVLGPGLPSGLVAGNICAQLAAGKRELRLGNVASARDFIDVRDAVEAFIKIFESERSYQVYNVCTGKATSIVELVNEAGAVFNVEPKIHCDDWLIKKQDFNMAYGNPTKIKGGIGWEEKYSLYETIQSMASALS